MMMKTSKTSNQYVTIPLEDFRTLLYDAYSFIAAANCLNELDNPKERLEKAKQDLAEGWRGWNKKITNFDKLIDYLIKENVELYNEDFDDCDYEETEYDLYCK